MDVNAVKRFNPLHSKPARLVVIACVAAVIPVAWMARQSRLTTEALDRATAAEKAAAQARDDIQQQQAKFEAGGQPRKDPAVRRSRHDDPAEIARVKQLYEEIEDLSEIQDRVEQELSVMHRIRARTAKEAAAATVPLPAPRAKAAIP